MTLLLTYLNLLNWKQRIIQIWFFFHITLTQLCKAKKMNAVLCVISRVIPDKDAMALFLPSATSWYLHIS